MQTTLGVEVLGVVQPAAVQAVAATRRGKVGVLGTPATVATGAYAAAIAAIDPFVEVVSVPCGDLAMRIESGTIDVPLVEEVRGYCAPLREAGVDAVILGLHALSARAPHHPAHARTRRRRSSRPARRSRARSSTCSARAASTARAGGEGSYGFLCTGDPAAFRAQGTRFLQLPLGEVEQVRLGGSVGGAVAA